MAARYTRRQVLVRTAQVGGGLVLLAGAGAIGHELTGPTSSAAGAGASGTGGAAATGQFFLTRPDLRPPRLHVTLASPDANFAGVPDPVLLLAMKHPGVSLPQLGLMMVDRTGELVWFQPLDRERLPFDLQVQTYRGQPVLTYWEGQVVDGHGEGTAYMLDASYQQIAAFTGVAGTRVDLHEFTLTPEGTALMTAFRTADVDLRPVGGIRHGQAYAGQVQEIDVATGRVVSVWDSLDHIPVTESYAPTRGHKPMDYFHINSISLDTDGNLLVSGRSTWAVYKIERHTGEVMWRLGGKKSDFKIGKGANFERQHHVRMHPGNRLSIFDNADKSVEPATRGVVLQLDTDTMTAELFQEFVHPDHLLADNQGSMQWDPESRTAVLGYGNLPRMSAFDANGNLSFDAFLGLGVQSYRALAATWHGRPKTDPDVVVTKQNGGLSVAVSWNGATDVTHWRVLGGSERSKLQPVTVTARDGFETTISVAQTYPMVAVEALAGDRQVLGRSSPLLVRV